jgi:hypothetical protein
MGDVVLLDEIYAPERGSRHVLVNEDGSGADAIVFRLARDVDLPELPVVPIATEPPQVGEEVFLIGFGRERDKVIELHEGSETTYAFEWTDAGRKRWGTNRVIVNQRRTERLGQMTQTFRFTFDVPRSAEETRFEAQAAVGDSGGAVFVKRDGEWLLAGMMILVSTESVSPHDTTSYGDSTFAADLSEYRGEIHRWARPVCANELDDDGDRKIDFPVDPGCHAYTGRDERDSPPVTTEVRTAWTIGAVALGLIVAVAFTMFRRREGR